MKNRARLVKEDLGREGIKLDFWTFILLLVL